MQQFEVLNKFRRLQEFGTTVLKGGVGIVSQKKNQSLKESVEFVKEHPIPCLVALCIGLLCLSVMGRKTERDREDRNQPAPTVKKEPAITREEGLQILLEWKKAKKRSEYERELSDRY